MPPFLTSQDSTSLHQHDLQQSYLQICNRQQLYCANGHISALLVVGSYHSEAYPSTVGFVLQYSCIFRTYVQRQSSKYGTALQWHALHPVVSGVLAKPCSMMHCLEVWISVPTLVVVAASVSRGTKCQSCNLTLEYLSVG